MPNYRVYNTPNNALYVIGNSNPNSPVVTTDLAASYANIGKYYVVNTGSQVVSNASGYLVMEVKNPANSGKTLYISRIRAGSTVATTLDIFKNATITGSPTSATPQNTNYSYSNSSVVQARWLSVTADPTTGGILLYTIIQVGGPGATDFDGRIIIPSTTSDQYFYLRIHNTVSNSNCAIQVSWWEV